MKFETKPSEVLTQISDLLSQVDLVPVGLNASNLHLFCKMSESGTVEGVIGVETYGDSFLLRSLAVREGFRNQGIARSLLDEAFQFAKSNGYYHAYLLTETIGDVMHRQGFREVPRCHVPEEMQQSPFLKGICKCSTPLMYKNIGEEHQDV